MTNNTTPTAPVEESNLVRHARYELTRAGLLDRESDYDGMLGAAVLELIETFSAQGHSGASAAAVAELLVPLARFEPISDLTDDPDEWFEVTDGLWQSRRMSDAFSRDGGRTFTRNSTVDKVYTSNRVAK